ncbi:HNH endonuclease [Peribacillus loiseleuriae]|uniref:HNH endonuclease n=1 Tax=Peribacillus loiseleuriae TaxID=1679170 RepID=UPI003D081694
MSNFYLQKKYSKKRGDCIYYNPECKERTCRRVRRHRIDNLEHVKHVKRLWHKKNAITEREKKRQYCLENLEKLKMKQVKFQQSERGKEKLKGYGLKRSHKHHQIQPSEWIACKSYFDNSCADCGMTYAEHKRVFKQGLHKEHVIHEGRNELKNCVPACKGCNSKKWMYPFNDWYNSDNENISMVEIRRSQLHFTKEVKLLTCIKTLYYCK